MKVALASVLLVLLVACGADGDRAALWGERPTANLDLRIDVGATEVALLESFDVVLDTFVGEGLDAAFEPEVPDGFEGDVDRGEPVSIAEPAGSWTRYTLRLAPTELGEMAIPSFRIEAGDHVATTPERTITVGSVLTDGSVEAEAPAPLFDERTPAWVWWVVALAGVGLVALVVVWRRWRARARIQPDAVPKPPHVKALRALARLRDARRTTPAEIDAFYVGVSDVLRTYLEARFGLHAPERTTEEFLPEVERSGLLDGEQRQHLRGFLEQCDLVKFAALQPGEAEHRQVFEFAEGFVESTRADRVAPSDAREEVPA